MSRLKETRQGSPGSRPTEAPGRVQSVSTDLLTVTDAAVLLRVSRRTVERLVARGQLPYIALPLRRGGLRFRRTELEDFLRKRHQDALT
jgi:excisionase family DNA binding protein